MLYPDKWLTKRTVPGSGRRVVLVLLTLTALYLLVRPENSCAQVNGARSLFEQGLILYRNGNYEGAQQTLVTALERYPNSAHTSKMLLLLSALSEKNGDSAGAVRYAARLVRAYPASRYRDAAEFSLARHSYRRSEPLQALHHLLVIIDRGQNPALVETAKMAGTRILSQGLGEKGLETFMGDFGRAQSRNWLLFWLARQEYGHGRSREGDLWLQRLQMNAPEARLQRLVQDMKLKPAQDLLYPLRIGLILPLSGFESANGYDFLRGVALALQDQPGGIEILLKDSGSSIKQAIHAMQELLDNHVDLVIGELAGDRSAAIAALAAERQIPVLVPVASDNDIATLGARVFQMTSDLERRGAALAEYAYNTLGLRTFVSLAPADDYGQAMSDAFANAVDRLGGTIIAQQWYYPGTPDVTRQFTAIRASADHFSPRDSLAATAFLQGRNIRENLDFSYSRSLHPPVSQDKDEEDDDLTPVSSIDGFFMPVYAEDISIVAPQFSLSHIQAVPLGGDDWHNLDVLRAQKRYVDGAVFCAGSYADETSMEFIQFKNRFRLATTTSPGPLALSGYDLTRLIAAALRAGNRTGDEVTAWFSKNRAPEGIANRYWFNPEKRTNQKVAVLQYKNGVISRLQD